jgi:hypothetical protein
MTKKLGLALAMLLALGLGGCGDDDGGGEGTGTNGGGGSGSAGRTGSSGTGSAGRGTAGSGTGTGTGTGTGGDNVFGNYDCSGTPAAGSCDQALCGLQEAYDSIQSSCSGAGAPAFCDAIGDCILDLSNCFEDACPSGDMATAEASTCVSEYLTCIQGATSMAGG